MLIALIVLLYKLRFANLLNSFIGQWYLVIQKIYKYLFLLILIQLGFAYSFKVIFDIDKTNLDKYGFISLFEAFRVFYESPFGDIMENWQKISSKTPNNLEIKFFIGITIVVVIVVFLNLILFNFVIAVIIKKYSSVSGNTSNHKHFNRAQVIFADQVTFKIKESFIDNHFVVQVVGNSAMKEKKKTI
jgi:hypothetical protein